MSSSVDTQQEVDELVRLREDVKEGKWDKVIDTYRNKSELRTVEIMETGDTLLHIAVSKGSVTVVAAMVKILDEKETPKDKEKEVALTIDEDREKNSNVDRTCVLGAKNTKGNVKPTCILGAKNKKGNTPLHLAASKGSVQMCEAIGAADDSLITICNGAGETPLFTAAFHGNREAFIWLHYLCTKRCRGPSTSDTHYKNNDNDTAHYKNDDNDTILHCAIAGGHIDLAIDIVLLYKGDDLKHMTLMHNKNGLSPLHYLAATPSAFESTDLLGRSLIVQLFYGWCFKGKKKEQATTTEELKSREHQLCIEALMDNCFSKWCDTFCKADCLCTWYVILSLLGTLTVLFLLALPLFLEIMILPAGSWFHGIRKMKEKHTWSLQITEELCRHFYADMTANSHEVDRGKKPETASKIAVDTPLLIAAKNGVKEMVETIRELCSSSTMEDVNREGKNIVLLAAEKRQTKLFQILTGSEYPIDKSVFRQMDKDGNTALHLAAKHGVNLTWQTTTMVEEYKWFQFVKNSVPYELWEIYDKEGKTAEEIFRDSYKEHMTSDRKWLDQTSQTCSVASTLVAGMAFSNFAGENIDKKNNSSLVALSLSLTSTISFLAILAFRSQSLNFWKYVPFMLHIAILTMFGSIVALWISLMFHGQSIKNCAILGFPIATLTIVSLPIFIGPTVMPMFNKVPPPNRNTTNAIQYRRPQKENGVDEDQKPTPNRTVRANDPMQDTTGSPMTHSRSKRMKEALQVLISDMIELEAQLKDP